MVTFIPVQLRKVMLLAQAHSFKINERTVKNKENHYLTIQIYLKNPEAQSDLLST